MDNRRRRTRVPFHTKVDIQTTGARILDLDSRDLSHSGLFVLGDLPLHAGQECFITVHLSGAGPDAPELNMEGKVVRVLPDGVAMDFVSMDPQTYLHLRNLVMFNSPDPDSTEEEFSRPAFDFTSEKD